MARPQKTGLDYFPLDIDFFQDEKIIAISGEFGIVGQLAVIRLLTAIYRKGYYIVWSEMMLMKMLHDLPGQSAETISSIVERLVNWNFFDKDLYEKERVLTSRGIQSRYFSAIKRRTANFDEIPYILDFEGKENLTKRSSSSSSKTPRIESAKTAENPSAASAASAASASPASRQPEPADLKEQVEDYKTRQIWLADMSEKFRISRQAVCERLDEFYLEMRCREVKVNKLPGVFIPWLNEKLNSKQNRRENGYNSNNNAARRGGSKWDAIKPFTPSCGLIE